jgi:predicted kinase
MADQRTGGDRAAARVHLLCGLTGAGKTTHARRLAAELPAVRFSLDEWMLRLYALKYDDPEYVARLDGCQSLIWDMAQQVLRVGSDVVLDWNQWSRQRRATWRHRVEAAGYGVLLHHVDVPLSTAVRQALARGAREGSHLVDEAGVRHLAGIFEPPTHDEGIETVTVAQPSLP